MNMLPTQFLTKEFPPTSADDFIGPARVAALALEKMVASSRAHGFAPIKLFYQGPPGTGKTALGYYLAHLTRATQWAVQEFNGTDFSIDVVRELSASLHLTHNELFGDYRIIAVQEFDRMTEAAQVGVLTLLDNLPRRTIFFCTTNAPLRDFEKRLQRRFKYTEIQNCTTAELAAWITAKWGIPEAEARGIALHSAGSPGLAVTECEEWIQTNAA